MSVRSIRLLIAALGGEGGGLLTDWIVAAAMRADLPVQSTSIPGVAQRTGATTYYLEIFPATNESLSDARPALALYPSPGDIDVMIATELLEIGRSMAAGFVTPDRTVLLGATHRIYSIGEKMAMSDRRFESARIFETASELARRAILFDLTRNAQTSRLPLNAVLLGTIAGAGGLPIPADAFRAAIVASGIAIETNLAGFDLGLSLAADGVPAEMQPEFIPPETIQPLPADPFPELANFPVAARKVIEAGIERLVDYQDRNYATLYLERLRTIYAVDREPWLLLTEAARHLALWMAYEDIVRVAELKTRPDRMAKIRGIVHAKPDEPVRVTEFFKPGIEEIASLLPVGLGRRLQAWVERSETRRRLALPLHVRSSSITGFLQLRFLASFKSWRRHSLRFREEHAMMEAWLEQMILAAGRSPALALSVARCAQLLKGYGDTYRHGRANFRAIFDRLIVPACSASEDRPESAAAIDDARKRALIDPEASLVDDLRPIEISPPITQ